MPIQKLPPLLVSQIAAGEVIERPASVVKELVENSLDAGATRIEIDVRAGGRELIRVSDNGVGMGPEDLALAFAPHATSKLTAVEDLFAIATLGFRGEALASIAAVSEARIVSRPVALETAHEVRCRGEVASPVQPAAGPPGTAIDVANLFFNTPARRKFLRTDATEVGHIAEQLLRLALPHPRVAFRLSHNGKLVHDLAVVPDDDPLARIRELLGVETTDKLLPVERSEPGLSLAGWVAPPSDSRANDRWQYLFLNGRYIRDRTLSAALREAYRGLLEVHRRPVAFLHYTVDPADVDVNVHPTKTEVRFRRADSLYRQTLSAVRECLLGGDLAPMLQVPTGAAGAATGTSTGTSGLGVQTDGVAPVLVSAALAGSSATSGSFLAEGAAPPLPTGEHAERVRSAMADFFRRTDPVQTRIRFEAQPRRDSPGSPERARPPSSSQHEPSSPNQVGPSRPLGEPTALPDEPNAAPAEEPMLLLGAGTPSPAAGSAGSAAVQLHNAFIVAETADGLVVIDQHALHERILYEQIKARVESAGALPGQRLLLPVMVELAPRRSAVLGECRELLARLGMEVDDFGNGTAAIQSVPTMLRRADPAKFLLELLDSLADDRDSRGSPEALLHKAIDMAACKAAVKAGDPLTPGEIAALLAAREAVEQHHTCAHGRPTTLKLTVRELERQFRRH